MKRMDLLTYLTLTLCVYENIQFQFAILQVYLSHRCDFPEWKLNYPSNLNGIMNTLIQIQLLTNDFPFLTIISHHRCARKQSINTNFNDCVEMERMIVND